MRQALTRAAAIVVILACGVAAQIQASTWADSTTLWRHAIQATGGSWLAFQNLGDALRDTRQLDDARNAYAQALALLPPGDTANRALIHNDLGLVLAQQGALPQALAEFSEAARNDASLLEPHVNRGNVLAGLGRFPEAEQDFRAALSLAPHTEEALVGLGSTLLSQGKVDAAILQYEEATRLNPGLAAAWANLGIALMQKGRLAEAQAAAQRALNIDPSSHSAKLVLETIKREDRR
jgi:tetratricopeptide (TPR) repeat protein